MSLSCVGGMWYITNDPLCNDKLKRAEKEIDILKTYNLSIKWYLADEKRKNAALTERINEYK